MIRDRLNKPDSRQGALLDGFPRTPPQAEALNDILAELGDKLDAVLYIKVPEDVLIRRLSGRWMCRAVGHVFHEQFSPPRTPGICDHDGSELYQRDDDREQTVAERIRVYMDQTTPLIEFYRQRGLLVEVDGDQPIDDVTDNLIAALPSESMQ